MVVKLEGTLNGDKIIFTRKQGDLWETIIPQSLDGMYIVELVATDEAGNQGYACRYILTVDLTSLHIHLIPYLYYAQLVEAEYSAKTKLSDYYATLIKPECERDGAL